MRAPLLGDAVAAARALLRVAEGDRPALLEALLAEARIADRHRRAVGRSHAGFGDGSLMAAALARGCVPEPSLDDADYCRCLAFVLNRLADGGSARGLREAAGLRRPLSS